MGMGNSNGEWERGIGMKNGDEERERRMERELGTWNLQEWGIGMGNRNGE